MIAHGDPLFEQHTIFIPRNCTKLNPSSGMYAYETLLVEMGLLDP